MSQTVDSLKIQDYKRLLASNPGNVFFNPWARITFRNVKHGKLVRYRTEGQYREKQIPMWVTLKLTVFRNKNKSFFPIYACDHCDVMRGFQDLSLNQNIKIVSKKRCIHSIIAEHLVQKKGDWREIWPVNLDAIRDDDEMFNVQVNIETEYVTLREDSLFLGAVYHKTTDTVTNIFTATKATKSMICERCKTKPCEHITKFKKAKAKDDLQGNLGTEPQNFWNRNKSKNKGPPAQHLKDQNIFENGYNLTKIKYPIKRDEEFAEKFNKSKRELLVLPESFIPSYDEEIMCQHQNKFDPSNSNLRRLNPEGTIKIYTVNQDILKTVKNYGRPTLEGKCRCIQQIDSGEYMLYNLGSSRFIEYSCLMSGLHSWCCGSAFNASFNARASTFNTSESKSDLSESNWRRGLIGFAFLLEFEKSAWVCPRCGETPPFIVCDGKAMGTLSSKTTKIQELDRHPLDEDTLGESTKLGDRVFLKTKSERDLLTKLVTNKISAAEFLESELIVSQNCQLIKSLVTTVHKKYENTIPKEYLMFLADLGKKTSVPGFLQVTGPDGLQYLEVSPFKVLLSVSFNICP